MAINRCLICGALLKASNGRCPKCGYQLDWDDWIGIRDVGIQARELPEPTSDIAKKILGKAEKVFVKHRGRAQTMLREYMDYVKKTQGKYLDKKIGTKKAERFWKLLEKIAVSNTVSYNKHVRNLLTFLSEQNVIQPALPFVLEMILG